MKKVIVLLAIAAINGTQISAQECSVGDNLFIKFEANDNQVRVISSQDGFCHSIIQTNRSPVNKLVYRSPDYSEDESLYGNFYFKLEKKSDSGFISVELPTISNAPFALEMKLQEKCGKKADSAYRAYDIERQSLKDSESDTLCFNLLKYCESLDSGEYRFQLFFRIGNGYSINKSNGNREITRLYYVNSDWYYFKIQHHMEFVSSADDINGLPICHCSSNKDSKNFQ